MKSRYMNLLSVVNQLKEEKVDMKRVVKKYENELAQKDRTIEDLSKTRTKLQTELKRIKRQKESLKKQKKQAEQDVKAAKTEAKQVRRQAEKDKNNIKADGYYQLGQTLKKEFDKSIIKIGGDSKKEIIQKAYNYFKQAEKLGHTEASKMVKFLESEKKYRKKITK